ncbi:hypothetical protein K2173_022437 [Erythroxylum novogranatense]|uniref:Uncharacterized protein n=1 Tax=Erythroxylum novogranatense TaxID=1862640 RepID=A0AAV8S663_9ROSI|nr:hypothetical protein K2173_013050 [Erythroxylum novogranatense]KAJ8766378.1 hypothetical protein K2173_022437 [Erythroxylum novogranatense]
MASGASKSAAFVLLILNVLLYFIMTVIATWAMNHGIQLSRETASALPIPARIFPIYFPIGNTVTGFFVFFAILAGVVGITTSLTGLHNLLQLNLPHLQAATTSSLTSLAFTLLAMGFASKEIDIGWTDSNLRTLEVVTIMASVSQLFCTVAIHSGLEEALMQFRRLTGVV